MKSASRFSFVREEFVTFYNAWQAGKGQELEPQKRGFVIFGEDDFLRRELFRLLKQRLKPEWEEFNLVTYLPDQLTPEALENELKTYPMLATHRLILLEVTADKKNQALPLLAYLAEVSLEEVWLIIHWEMEDFNHPALMRHPQWKVIQCLTPYPSQLPMWLQQMAQRYQLTLTADALAALQERLPMDLSVIDQEMRRLRDAVDQQPVTLEHVEQFVGYQWEDRIFALLDCFLEKQVHETTRELEYFIRTGEMHPLQWIQLLARSFRQMKRLQEGEKSLRLASWQQKKLEKQLAFWSEKEIVSGLLLLAQWEDEIKSLALDEREWFLNRWMEWTLDEFLKAH